MNDIVIQPYNDLSGSSLAISEVVSGPVVFAGG